MKPLFQILTFLTSMLLIGTFLAGLYDRWSASRGPKAIAVVLSKNDYVPKKSAVHIYNIRLAFKPESADSIVAETEISAEAYSAIQPKNLIPIHYETYRPKQVVLASDGWFQWRSLGVLAFGLVLLYAGVTAKEGKRQETSAS
ncbi:hypothetical protein Q5H92_26190 [Hymenobacter sp. M29]|uniref:DUF3592 domain-containing protein n=1 Tax=Hymenobacter mellowenesis TaxID=3063995 RepID=A0ABT9ALI8_9BACT|nr:hypothetical protein [Hymenobacter sp. M29]MDO7849877.1 hypothetical protein [Hymenobacter sp. M29]